MNIDKPKNFRLNTRLKPNGVVSTLPHRRLDYSDHFICGCDNENITLIEYSPTTKIVWIYTTIWMKFFPNTNTDFNDTIDNVKVQFLQHLGWIPEFVYLNEQKISYIEYEEISINH